MMGRTPDPQSWILAEAVVDQQDFRPDWALPPQQVLEAKRRQTGVIMDNTNISITLSRHNPVWTIPNESPLWVAITAEEIVSYDGSTVFQPASNASFQVTPAYGYLAPKVGTTNLCKENDCYQDFCEFRVTFPLASNDEAAPEQHQRNDSSTISIFLVAQNEETENWVIEIAT
jgi:hypothetical protein